ncbi:MAG: hypothetical protein ACXWWD_08595 [Chitinophagaceae bacterium]
MKTILSLLLLPLNIFAQDIEGVWTGFIQTSGNTLPYELVISETKDKLTGFSLTVFTIGGVENTGVKSMKIKKRKGKISIEDDKLIYNNYTTPAKRVVLISTLSLSAENSIQILAGTFMTRSLDRTSFKGTIRLEKRTDYSETKLISRLNQLGVTSSLSFIPSPVGESTGEIATAPATTIETPTVMHPHKKEEATVPVSKPLKAPQLNKASSDSLEVSGNKSQPIAFVPAATELDSRKTEILQSFFFESDSLTLSLYDNGEIDGDTVSVVLNDVVIIEKKRLSVTAITKTIYIPANGDSLRLIMYAENLGRIPPNTGLLIIQDKDERYEIRFEGDFQKNSGIILRRKR